MSSTGRAKNRRIKHDVYETPPWAIRRLLEALPLPGGQWLEPCANNGSLIRVVNSTRSDLAWTAVELREEMGNVLAASSRTLSEMLIGDFLPWAKQRAEAQGLRGKPSFDVTLTNPPYNLAMEFIVGSMAISRFTVMLLRLNFLESDARADFMRITCPDVYVLPNRPPFTAVLDLDEQGQPIEGSLKVGTDSTGYGWFVWDRENLSAKGSLKVLAKTPESELKEWRAYLLEQGRAALLPSLPDPFNDADEEARFNQLATEAMFHLGEQPNKALDELEKKFPAPKSRKRKASNSPR